MGHPNSCTKLRTREVVEEICDHMNDNWEICEFGSQYMFSSGQRWFGAETSAVAMEVEWWVMSHFSNLDPCMSISYFGK